ncbi:MAG: D-hexose-6-phosphate mutarotase [Actinomycetota bacterium]|nr:D-hexose-6-phosphate mutarotase [Actinomycetota bacterium]
MAAQSIPAPIALTASGGTGEIYTHGAHLTRWNPSGSAPVIWVSHLARFEPGVAIRGGIPIILPWFGAGRSGDMTPAHGFARTRLWRLVEQGFDGDDAIAMFELQGSSSDDETFPYAFKARYEVRIGSALHLSLMVENTGEDVFSFEEALHTYFHVGDVRKIHVEGLDGCSYLDQADPSGLAIKQQSGDLEFLGETDRIYDSSSRVRVVDPVLGRALLIEKEHSASTVVWNPWIDKAQRMSDFGDDEWSSMVCIEGGNLRDAAVHLDPAQSHQMRYSVQVEAIQTHHLVPR